jgi:hypothetical protein
MTILGQNLAASFRSTTAKLSKFKPMRMGINFVHGLIYISEEFYKANTILRAEHEHVPSSKTAHSS